MTNSRILINQLAGQVNQEVTIQGRLVNLRKLGGNITFLIMRDYTGTIQAVFEAETEAKIGDVLAITGQVIAEPRAKGGLELQAKKVEVLVTSKIELPIDLSKPKLNLQLSTLLDYRYISLRHEKVQAIFKLYDLLLQGYESVMHQQGFTEIKSPKLLAAASEGGANFFKVKYFNNEAFLAQSPQFYKQMMVGVFERVFEIGSVFRAEPHFTSRHVNEYIGFDAEMGMINDFRDITKMLSQVMKAVFALIEEQGQEYLKLYGVEKLEVLDEIPHIQLDELKAIIAKEYKYEIPGDTDIDSEGEKLAWKYAKEKFNSDFIFVTHYPWKDRPFYTMPDPTDETKTLSFDLIYKGMEIASGGQRIHDYDQLMANIEKKGVKPVGMDDYLETFKFAMPAHGGWGLGSERIIQLMLGLGSIKEAVLFPRDVKRLRP